MKERKKYIINPEDEFILIKKKKKDKIKKQFLKEIDDILLDVVDEKSFDEYENRVTNWRWGE